MSQEVTLLNIEGGIATITLNRPNAYNALTQELQHSLVDRLHTCKRDDHVKVIILTGAGKGFCAGADVSLMVMQPDPRDVRDNLKGLYATVIRLIRDMHKPVIAAINGPVAGAGISIALACDYKVMSTDTNMRFAFINIGLVSDAGATWLLARQVGYTKALELLVDGDKIPAADCLQMGLVNRLEKDALAAATSWADKLSKRPPLAFYATKKAVNYAMEHGLYETIHYEAEEQMKLFASQDHKESVMAFLQKKEPVFKGK